MVLRVSIHRSPDVPCVQTSNSYKASHSMVSDGGIRNITNDRQYRDQDKGFC